jgi:hypothetical protein
MAAQVFVFCKQCKRHVTGIREYSQIADSGNFVMAANPAPLGPVYETV